MVQVVAYEDAKANESAHRGAIHTPFLKYRRDAPDEPVAFLSSGEPDRETEPHWHYCDEFLVVVGGKGKLGRHNVAPYAVHYASGLTPYGPILADAEQGLAYFVLFAHFDPGAQYFPKSMETLKKIPDRKPWQMKRQVQFPAAKTDGTPVILQDVPGMTDERGLFVGTIAMAPGAKVCAPDPSQGEGQYVLVVGGSLIYQERERKAYTLVHVKPSEPAFELHAGPAGLQAIVMNFPRKQRVDVQPTTTSEHPAVKKWQCELCAFVYDEALGMPEDGVPAGTRWEDVPETWTCPDCAAVKSDFAMVEVQ